MRLIDADELILHLNDYALQEAPFERGNTGEAYHAIENCIEAIKEQPTAYDVDGVVNELKREKFIESETTLSDVHQGYNAGLSRAVEIVKGGGEDEK